MKNQESVEPDEDLLPEYDFSDAEVGKYAERYARHGRTAGLGPKEAERFPTSEAAATPPETLAQRPPMREF